MKKLLITLTLATVAIWAKAQVPVIQKPGLTGTTGTMVQPFLFSVNTLTAETPFWNLQYSGSYGERTAYPFGYDGVDQQLSVKGYLGNRFTLFSSAALGFDHAGHVASAQQAEVIRDFIGGKKAFGARFGLGMGVSHDFSNTTAIFSRVTGSFEVAKWRVGGNLRFEKAFSTRRDDIDLITSFGFHHRIAGSFFAGVEAIGQDLEGFWEQDEAEGGAKLLVGPSINMAPANSRFAFSICGGPVFYATHSTVMPSQAIRDIPLQNGFTLRGMVSFNLHQ
ncbi:hypothetical protein MUY27_09400 [Mucilaginibacter sp. RS28]|uniref:Uncharacterized protein n=1 Tax=Mucilaginibacter straminoryzae TaxID=2932774 RepID=A0A9X2B8R9_9SPHI|nr:hypothetical protein [Mucilaginibacter straminoryzae]MCJ8209924.1 hypothetical protein [Mucilaginibacter straminoryzae]